MNIQISKESDVPLREQVFAQLVLLIATRKLKPGDSLPSVRSLGRILKIHHNTVSEAYQDLAAQGFLVGRRGSRLVVRSPEEPLNEPAHKDLDDLINETIKTARQQGYTLQQLRHRVRERLLDAPPDHLLVLSTDAGILAVVRRELEEALQCSVAIDSPAAIAANPALLIGALVLSGPGALPAVLSSLPKNRPAIPILFAPGEAFTDRRGFRQPILSRHGARCVESAGWPTPLDEGVPRERSRPS